MIIVTILINLVVWLICFPGAVALGTVLGVFAAMKIIEVRKLGEPESTWVLLVIVPACILPVAYGGNVLMNMLI